ncbi:MAG: hypothetical protein HYU41_19510 [Candidatus Rokubacteria bacterium]|nr:hypothetical protein [Candidatus Rokubacteria bacterium]
MAGRVMRITAGQVVAEGRLSESRTATVIWNALPIDARAQTWGDEIYFDIGIGADAESPQEVVAMGDLAYWPPGQAFCIFFGRTPASRGDEIRAASGVTVVGRVTGDATVFKRVRSGTAIRLERASEGGAKR